MSITLQQIHLSNQGKVSDKWASYLPYYDELFTALRNKPVNLLEIGVQNGGSLETWNKYFIHAGHLLGCDIDEGCRRLEYDSEKIKVVVGDANRIEIASEIFRLCNEFDIVIDDGSHVSNDILKSFMIYFEHLKPGGLYVIEDTHTLYSESYGGGVLNELSAYAFFKKIIDLINYEFWSSEIDLDVFFSTFFRKENVPKFIKEGMIESIEFRNSIVVIKKSFAPGFEKLGGRLVTGTSAIVNDTPLKLYGIRDSE